MEEKKSSLMFEKAEALASYMKSHDFTQQQAADRLKVSQSFIANKIRLLQYTIDQRQFILAAHLTERQAREVLRLKEEDARCDALAYIARNHLNIAQTEAYIDSLLQKSQRQVRVVIKDMGLFFNTVENAIGVMRNAGMNVFSNRTQENGVVDWHIQIVPRGTI